MPPHPTSHSPRTHHERKSLRIKRFRPGPYLLTGFLFLTGRYAIHQLSTRQRVLADTLNSALRRLGDHVSFANGWQIGADIRFASHEDRIKAADDYSHYLFGEMQEYLRIHKMWEGTVRELRDGCASKDKVAEFAESTMSSLNALQYQIGDLVERVVELQNLYSASVRDTDPVEEPDQDER